MGRPRNEDREEPTPDALLRAAEEEFGLRGLAGARLEDVAARVGIGRASLLYHFKSKEELYTAVVHRAFAEIGASILESLESQGPLAKRVASTTREFEQFLIGRPGLAPLVLREIVESGTGRNVLLEEGVPLLKELEVRMVQEDAGIPARSLILHLFLGALVRASAPELRKPLWGSGDPVGPIVQRLFERS